jgi:uncharacterized protein (TIGR02145 family)
MKQKMMFLALTLMMLSAASVNAQVTIGSTDDPHAGAVLDLQSTTQGLKLPTVSLDDIITFGLDGDAGTAIGMMVYNTNASIKDGNGKGIYVWNGKKWNIVNMDNNEDTNVGLTTAKIGNHTYKIYTYPDGVGTWMLENSKEGTASFTTYTGHAEGELGYYYTFAQAPAACPNAEGWFLPTYGEWYLLMTYLNAHTFLPSTWTYWLDGKILGGAYADVAAKRFTHWGGVAWYWTSTKDPIYNSCEGRLNKNTDGGGWSNPAYLVRCIKR